MGKARGYIEFIVRDLWMPPSFNSDRDLEIHLRERLGLPQVRAFSAQRGYVCVYARTAEDAALAASVVTDRQVRLSEVEMLEDCSVCGDTYHTDRITCALCGSIRPTFTNPKLIPH